MDESLFLLVTSFGLCCGAKSIATMSGGVDERAKERVSTARTGDLRELIGQVIVDEVRQVVRAAAQQIIAEHEEVEELKDRIKNYEDHILCLEQQVSELQLMLRSTSEKDSAKTEEEEEAPNTPAHNEEQRDDTQREKPKKLVQLKSWICGTEEKDTCSSANRPKLRHSFHHSASPSVNEGVLNDFY